MVVLSSGKRENSLYRQSLAYLFAFLLIITMQTVYVKLYNTPWELIANATLIVVAIILVAGEGRLYVDSMTIKVICVQAIIFTLIPVLQMLFLKSVNLPAMLMISALCIVLFSVVVIYIRKLGIKSFLDNLAYLIYLITVLSFPIYIFGQVLHVIRPSGSVVIEWGGVYAIDNYYFLLFVPQGASYHEFVAGRFCGIFAEAPMCAYMISVALIIMLFISDKKVRYSRIVFLCLAVIFTASTTGWIVCVLCIGFHFVFARTKTKLFSATRLILMPAMFVTAITIVFSLFHRKHLADVGSVSVRNDNFANAIRDFIDSPLFGLGFKSDTIGVTQGNTSVISNVIQQGGILFFVWYFAPIFLAVTILIANRKWKYLVAVGLYGMLLYATVVTYTAFSISLIAVFWVVVIDVKSDFSDLSLCKHRARWSI